MRYFLIYNLSFFLFLYSNSIAQQVSDSIPLDKAITIYKESLKKNPGSIVIAYNLAYSEYITGHYNDAIKLCRDFEKKTSLFQADFHIVHAASLDRLHRTSVALELMGKATQTFPGKPDAWYQLAFYQYKYHEFDKALPALYRAINLQPLNPQAHYLLCAIWYENNNYAACLFPMFYGMLTETVNINCQSNLAFCEAIFNRRHDEIQVPSYDSRIYIYSADQIFQQYEPEHLMTNFINSWDPDKFVSQANGYLSMNSQTTDTVSLTKNFYSPFFIKLLNSGNAEPAFYYMLRCIDHPQIKQWIKNHPAKMEKFADWLEKNLPGK